jgi:hypothetical protein
MLRAALAAIAVAVPGVALAGPFGGFAPDGRYLAGGDRLCEPVEAERAQPRCAAVSAADVAKLRLERPAPERGARARIAATARGTSVRLAPASGEPRTWDAGVPVGRVVATYLNKAGTTAAVEYESRFGGRLVIEVIGVRVPSPRATNAKPAAEGPAPPTPSSAPTLAEKEQKALAEALARGARELGRKRHARAVAAAGEALAIWDESGGALYLLAAAEMGRKKREEALAALERLATSSDPEAPEHRVEARTAKAFAPLRADPRFRRAVGITPDPKRPPTAYERAMGLGGVWEQRLIACEQPEVKLRLRRPGRKFILRIKGRCGGPAETTFLDGIWATKGSDVLHLTFPNRGADDEGLRCAIERCRDSSGEDCVRCRVDEELEFLLRVIRR